MNINECQTCINKLNGSKDTSLGITALHYNKTKINSKSPQKKFTNGFCCVIYILSTIQISVNNMKKQNPEQI